MSVPLLLVLIALAVLIWAGYRFTPRRAAPISPTDPLWVEAVERARATLPAMRVLYDGGREVWVKFPLATLPGGAEHVWGRIAAWQDALLRCTIETPPLAAPKTPTRAAIEVPLGEIEDWQVVLEDGSIRGGYTTRAQVRIAERDGQPVPRHVREMLTRMTD